MAALAIPTTGSADGVHGLRAEERDLAARERSALLELYALDSRLGRTQAELAGIETRVAELKRERTSAQQLLRAARATLAGAERRLGVHLRLLYEQDQPDPLAIVLGATSLDEALTGLDSLSRAARATSNVIAAAREARDGILRLTRSLGDRRGELQHLRATVSARAAELAAARAEHVSLIERLRTEKRLTARAIDRLEAEARAARALSEARTIEARAVGSVAALVPQPAATKAPSVGELLTPARPPALPSRERTLRVLSTGYALPGRTATGLLVGPGVVAVDPSVIPLGTRLTIPGYGEGVAADVGSAIQGFRIDLWFPTRAEALGWGWRTITIVLH